MAVECDTWRLPGFFPGERSSVMRLTDPGAKPPVQSGSQSDSQADSRASDRSSNVHLEHADDRALVEEAVAGNRAAFDAIVERHQRTVYQICYRFAGNHADASDLAQEVFLRAYRALGRFKGEASLKTWLYRVAVNACLNKVGSRATRFEPLDAERHVDTRGEPPDEPLRREQRARFVKAGIARLPRKQRATLILRIYHDLPHEEIARILGSSVGAVKANFFHAVNNLKRHLSQDHLP
jgi:RNA polymerase sigma-70 factor (ECF subfamily)